MKYLNMNIQNEIYDLVHETAWSSIWRHCHHDLIKKNEINSSIHYNVSRLVVDNVITTSQHMKELINVAAKEYEYSK